MIRIEGTNYTNGERYVRCSGGNEAFKDRRSFFLNQCNLQLKNQCNHIAAIHVNLTLVF